MPRVKKDATKVHLPQLNLFSRLQSLFRRVAGYAVVGFERVTFRPSVRVSVRPSVRVSVRMSLDFRPLDRVRAPSPRPLYSVGECYMIQLNDSESLVSVQQIFSKRGR